MWHEAIVSVATASSLRKSKCCVKTHQSRDNRRCSDTSSITALTFIKKQTKKKKLNVYSGWSFWQEVNARPLQQNWKTEQSSRFWTQALILVTRFTPGVSLTFQPSTFRFPTNSQFLKLASSPWPTAVYRWGREAGRERMEGGGGEQS